MADIDAPLSWRMKQDGYLMQINQLRDERDKLRELVQDIEEVADPYLWEFIGRRKKTLGIEVDA